MKTKCLMLFSAIVMCFPKVSAAKDDGGLAVVTLVTTVVGTGLGWALVHAIRSSAEEPDSLVKEYSGIVDSLNAGQRTAILLPKIDQYIAKIQTDSSRNFRTNVLRNNYFSALKLQEILKDREKSN